MPNRVHGGRAGRIAFMSRMSRDGLDRFGGWFWLLRFTGLIDHGGG